MLPLEFCRRKQLQFQSQRYRAISNAVKASFAEHGCPGLFLICRLLNMKVTLFVGAQAPRGQLSQHLDELNVAIDRLNQTVGLLQQAGVEVECQPYPN